ncbi:protein RGF1 INDUCIBLE TRANSCRIPTION FACTOR 1-like [Impatiens glandulifera]|uniref:protein RGF1 INDUCIBLE TRANSCRIPTION FACTOR 1-like n=1 Tax=Impatiens glandulifera TaxID=253017 RepID=UPI001FB05FAC|nr:protein RGF1 INDUCIBLE TRANSCRIPTION FACTOR 1-like [Impatiens glandulifera]
MRRDRRSNDVIITLLVGFSSSSSAGHLPPWLQSLLVEKFFNACLIHQDFKKNEKNIFCLDCCEGICPHCLSLHRSHRLLQIRRYVYHDVLRLGDADKLMDCGFVQSYTTNSAKVVFLKQRPQSRPCRSSGNICVTCDRALQEPYCFCSISCKLNHIIRTSGNLSKYIVESNCINLPDPGLEEGQFTPESVIELVGVMRTSSGSSGGSGGFAAFTGECTAGTGEVVRKKRSSINGFRSSSAAEVDCREMMCSSEMEIPVEINNSRRKSTPHRAPLY